MSGNDKCVPVGFVSPVTWECNGECSCTVQLQVKPVSPSLKYDMYTQDTQFVFMPTNIFTVPAVIGSPATGRVPTYEFTVNLEGHLVTFTLGTSYLSPVPFPIDFSHSPSTNMGETTGEMSARSANGQQGAANTKSSRGNQQAAAQAGVAAGVLMVRLTKLLARLLPERH